MKSEKSYTLPITAEIMFILREINHSECDVFNVIKASVIGVLVKFSHLPRAEIELHRYDLIGSRKNEINTIHPELLMIILLEDSETIALKRSRKLVMMKSFSIRSILPH